MNGDHLNTFSDEATQKIVEMVFQRMRAGFARQIHHLGAMRQHEGYDSFEGGPKIVTAKQVLYAAWGGGGADDGNFIDYGNADSNALAISLGNYVPYSEGSLATGRRRVVYPRLCYVWELDSSNVLQRTTEEIYVVNFGGLPIVAGTQFSVQQLSGSEYYVPVEKSSGICHPAKQFISEATVSLDGDATPKLVRTDWELDINPPLSGANSESDFAHAEEFDVFIHHPGVYAITFGMSVQRVSGDSADDSTYTDTGGDTVDIPNSMHFEGALFRNYNPAGGNITTQFSNGDFIGVSVGPRESRSVIVERTIMVTHTLDNWHGQPYMRLSFAAKCYGGGADAASASGQLDNCWINVRPMGGGGYNEGSGFNAFNGGTYQWWGQGTEPDELFDADGVEIP